MSERHDQPGVAAIVPAMDEAQRLGSTLAALARVPQIGLVVVVDDGSRDDTAQVATAAGVTVLHHERNRGKAAAVMTGAAEVGRLDDEAGRDPRPMLFVDADLEDSAEQLGKLCDPVLAGGADMTIATLPPQRTKGGGFGLVVRMARTGIERLTGFSATQPLSGMRCLTREVYTQVSPLASGWGVEVGLTVDALRAGARVVEVPCDLQHRVTGRDLRGQLHRARQYRDVWWALARRGAWAPRRARA